MMGHKTSSCELHYLHCTSSNHTTMNLYTHIFQETVDKKPTTKITRNVRNFGSGVQLIFEWAIDKI